MKIISTSQLQKNIGNVSKEIEEENYVIINRGRARMVILPYFDSNDDAVNDYLEEYEISKNSKKLKKDLKESFASGLSDLTI